MLETPAFIPGWHTPMLDPVSTLVAGLIDGRRSADDIVEALSPRIKPVLVYYVLEWLEQQGCIAEAAGAPVAEASPAVVEVDDFLDPRLEEWNRRALATGKPWMIAGPGSIGPLFRPGCTACWKCLAARLEQNRPAWPAERPCVNLTPPMLEGAIWTAGPAGLRRHFVTRRPQCPACGGGQSANPWHPERHVSPITGIVGELAVCRGAGPTHLAVAVHNEAVVAVGKGRTEIEARVTCLAEAVERYSCRWQGDEPRVRASWRELGDQAVKYPRATPFDEDAVIDWTPVRSLTHNRTSYVPTACCYFAYPQDESRRFCRADSNGCAAGNTLNEAVQRGLLELIERDATAIWRCDRVRRPAVDLRGFDDPYFTAMSQYVEQQRRTLDVLDLTSELGVPVFAAVSATKDGRGPLLGYGAHLDPRTAVASALAELSQMLAADPAAEGQEVRDWLETATLANQPHLVPAPGVPRILIRDREGVVADPAEILAKQGREVLVLDLTRPDIGLPVARVIVPGLRHL